MGKVTGMRRAVLAMLLAFGLLLMPIWGVVSADTTDSTTYGSGNYGVCDYGSCTITLSSAATTNIDITPSGTSKCSVQSNAVSVTTDSATGYSLTMTTSGTNTSMTYLSNNLTASSGTAASPTALATNTWGWRVDGLSGFGAGPTSSLASGAVPSVTFAGVPASNGTPSQLALTSAAANPAVVTTVWYGACASPTAAAGTYTATVTYTAVTN